MQVTFTWHGLEPQGSQVLPASTVGELEVSSKLWTLTSDIGTFVVGKLAWIDADDE